MEIDGLLASRVHVSEKHGESTMTPQTVDVGARCEVGTSPEQFAAAATRWRESYRRSLVITDAVIVAAVVFASQALRVSQRTRVSVDGFGSVNYFVISTLLTGLWLIALWINGAYDQRILGTGASEYGRILRASLYLFGFIAIGSYLSQAEVARSYLAIALPLGLFGVMGGRWVWRRLLSEYRRAGSHLNSVLIVGSPSSANELAQRLCAAPEAGLRVAGLFTPRSEPPLNIPSDCVIVADGWEVSRKVEAAVEAIRGVGADTVAVAASEIFNAEAVRLLGWKLEGSGVGLALAPALTDVAGPRIHISPVAGLPLMYVDEPRFKGPKLVVKTLLDLCLATVGLVLLSPLMLIVAAAIKVMDPGPVFFRQDRVGFGGRIFRVWKFRTMRQGADRMFAQAMQASGQRSSTFFKVTDDARITTIGRVLRRTSIDELPQLLNVMAGQMSIVGPRPLVPGEGADIGNFLERRSLVRPGITGLWQVSGRSDLSVEERVRLDSYYIENWSVTADLVIILRTIRAVATREGAY